MYKLDPRYDKMPISNEAIQRALNDIYIKDQEEIDNLEAEQHIKLEHIFNKDSRTIEGFSMKAIAQKNEKQEMSLYFTELIVYETEDEWFDEYKRINKANKKNSD